MASGSNVHSSYGVEAMVAENMPQALPQVQPSTDPPLAFNDPDKTVFQTDPHNATRDGGVTSATWIFGLSSRKLFILAGSITFLISIGIGVGIGVGVGVTQATSTSSEPPSPTRTSSESPSPTSAAVTSGTVGMAANICDKPEKRPAHTSPDGTVFNLRYLTYWPMGGPAETGDEPVKDLGAVMSYTFEDCMDKCASHNMELRNDDTRCEAITYASNLTWALEVINLEGNCVFKDWKWQDRSVIGKISSAYIID